MNFSDSIKFLSVIVFLFVPQLNSIRMEFSMDIVCNTAFVDMATFAISSFTVFVLFLF